MKIAYFKKVITPETGAFIAGYDFTSRSIAVLDDLYLCGLALDDGNKKALILSFDLLALDGHYVRKVRKECAEILGTSQEMILLSCTHNHSGPEAATPLAPNHDKLNRPYVEALHNWILEEVRALKDWKEVAVRFYSSFCDENRNRRYTTADNLASFQPHRRELIELCNGFADKELLQLCFFDSGSGRLLYVVGNYAAHPLAGHSPGLGGKRISADYPGAFRNYIKAESGAECMFLSGACGDMVPREDEMGYSAAKEMGIRLAKAALGGVMDSSRNKKRFTLEEPRLGGLIRTFTAPIRKKFCKRVPEEYQGKDAVTLELQFLSIGEMCLVGLPGEVCAELGQEIKWHSLFRKAMAVYYSTSDFSYMAPGNFLVSGGYEGSTQQFGFSGSFALLKCAVEGMNLLHKTVFPELDREEEAYPDYLDQSFVNIP